MTHDNAGLVRRLHQHALPDPHDEREVLHAPLLTEAADRIEQLTAERDALKAALAEFVGGEFTRHILKVASPYAAPEMKAEHLVATAERDRMRSEVDAMVAAERERCAKIVADQLPLSASDAMRKFACDAVNAIRQQGEPS
jgi:hypothetical protein